MLLGSSACTSLLGDDFTVTSTPVVNCAEDPTACINDHGTTQCVAGACTPVCAAGYETCDNNPANGCETELKSDVNHCGKCNQRCVGAHANMVCQSFKCELVSCEPGWADCNADPADGCEVNVSADKNNCGACGNICENTHGQTNCVANQCVPSCAFGFSDCDGTPSNGCETDTNLSPAHCGKCGNAVNPDQTCSGGQSVLASLCPSTNRDCNKDLVSDGCEVNVQADVLHCGACDVQCKSGEFCGLATCKSCVFLSEDFQSATSGWQVEGPWEIAGAKAGGGGPCTAASTPCGDPDPAMDHSTSADNGVAGVVIGGNYTTASPGPYYLTSPSMDLRGSGGVTLSFWRWLNSDAAPFIINSVEAFDGDAWKVVWSSPTGTTTQFVATEWTRFEYDLTPFRNSDDAKNASFRVRFGFAVGRAGAYIKSGWSLDDVLIRKTECGP